MLDENIKLCSTCGKFFPVSLFNIDRHKKDGYTCSCKTCLSAKASTRYFKDHEKNKLTRKEHYQKYKKEYLERSYEWRKNNPHKRQASEKKRNLKQKYNLSPEQLLSMYLKQDRKCGICKRLLSIIPDEQLPSACVDHCHTTGDNRGLLCRSCNLLLGNAGDSIEILKSSIEYLENYHTG